jgi:hypothetical protein
LITNVGIFYLLCKCGEKNPYLQQAEKLFLVKRKIKLLAMSREFLAPVFANG